MSATTYFERSPHIHIRDSNAYFMQSRRPLRALNEQEMSVFEALAEVRDIATLAQMCGPEAEQIANEFVADKLAYGYPTLPEGRRRILVIEPHCDDAALSVGATMLGLCHEVEFKVITIASRSNFSTAVHMRRPFLARDAVSDLRDAEGRCYMRHLGGEYGTAGLNEATLRYHDSDWSIPFLDAHQSAVSASNESRATVADLEMTTHKIKEILAAETADELWIPIAAGPHSDHDITRNAVLQALWSAPDLAAKFTIKFYEDVPYGVHHPEHLKHVLEVFAQNDWTLTEQLAPCADQLDEKLRLLGVFASQFKVPVIADGVRQAADHPTGMAERFWTIDNIGPQFDVASLWVHWPKALEVKTAIKPWPNNVKNLRFVFVTAPGPWAKHLTQITKAFPNATIEVFAHPKVLSGLQEVTPPEISLKPAPQGKKGWPLFAAKLAVAKPAHTVFLAGPQIGMAQKMSKLWPLSKTLVISDMDAFILALE